MSSSTKPETLTDYLHSLKRGIQSTGTVHCVLGNEAADLDSMVSALMYAFFLSAENAGSGVQYVPVVAIPRKDFKLRTEAVFLFEEAGINSNSLFFAEDIDPKALYKDRRLELTLVDHNKPTGAYVGFEDVVVGVVDHHADEGLFGDAPVRVVSPVGSAATLVAEMILERNRTLLDTGAAKLLLGTILLDTVNLDPEAGRVTPEDEKIAGELGELSGSDRQELFDAVQREKFNVSSLDSPDLLRKDYKEWQLGDFRVGISTVLLSVEEWLAKDPNLPGSLSEYCKARNLDVLLAMNAYTAPEFTRELVVYCPDDSLRSQLLDFLQKSDLELSPIESDTTDEATALFAQGNLGKSRKKLQPMLAEFLETH